MAWFDKLLALFGIEGMKVTLNLNEREGGYIFISSPELKGFSLLLEPGNYNDLKTFINAVDEPLTAYLDQYLKARSSVRHQALQLRATKITAGRPIVAKMCFQ